MFVVIILFILNFSIAISSFLFSIQKYFYYVDKFENDKKYRQDLTATRYLGFIHESTLKKWKKIYAAEHMNECFFICVIFPLGAMQFFFAMFIDLYFDYNGTFLKIEYDYYVILFVILSLYLGFTYVVTCFIFAGAYEILNNKNIAYKLKFCTWALSKIFNISVKTENITLPVIIACTCSFMFTFIIYSMYIQFIFYT